MRSDRSLGLPQRGAFPGIGLPGRDFADGVSQSGRERNHLFANASGASFADLSGLSGLDHPADGRAAAWLDFDRDGWLDVAVVNANAPFLQLFRNQLGDRRRHGDQRFVVVRLEGANRGPEPATDRSNRDGVGARVEVVLDGARIVRERRMGEGFAAQNSADLLVGIGDRARAVSVRVHWPSGALQETAELPAGSVALFHEPEPGSAGVVERAPYRMSAAGTDPRPPDFSDPPTSAPRLRLPSTRGAGDEHAGDGAALRVLTTLATWCEACRDELPEVAILRDSFPPEQVELYGVPVDPDDSSAALAAWGRQHRAPYRLLAELPLEERARVQAFVEATLQRDAIPATIVTDREGRLLSAGWGVPTRSKLRALLQRAGIQREGGS